jgi:hypothetical protein
MNNVDLRYRRTLSAGMASAASLALLSPGSSAHAIPAGVAAFRSNQRIPFKSILFELIRYPK